MTDALLGPGDGVFIIGSAEGRSEYTEATPEVPGWTRLVVVGEGLLFIREDGISAVGRIAHAGGPAQTVAPAIADSSCADLRRVCPRSCGCTSARLRIK